MWLFNLGFGLLAFALMILYLHMRYRYNKDMEMFDKVISDMTHELMLLHKKMQDEGIK